MNLMNGPLKSALVMLEILVIILSWNSVSSAEESLSSSSCQVALSFSPMIDELVQIIVTSQNQSNWKDSIRASMLSEKKLELEHKFGKALTAKIFTLVRERLRKLREFEHAVDQLETKKSGDSPLRPSTTKPAVFRPEVTLTIPAHSYWVSKAIFSHNNQWIASASYDGSIKIWDVLTGREIHSFERNKFSVKVVEFSHNDKLLLTGSWDGTIAVWDVNNGTLKYKYKYSDPNLTYTINAAVFSKDDKHILFSSSDKLIRILDLVNQEITFHTRTDQVETLAYSHDFKSFIAAGDNLQIWDTNTNAIRASMRGHVDGYINKAEFSPDDRNFVVSTDKEIVVFDALQFKRLFKLEGHTSLISSATYSPDGRFIATASNDQMVKLWDAKTGKFIVDLKMDENGETHSQAVNSAYFSYDSKNIVTASTDRTFRVWSLYKEISIGDAP